jgi:MSHA biogenesis protein MshN
MSLINDLLCDLETRNAPVADAGALAGLRPVNAVTTTPGRRWLLPLAGALVATSAFAVLHRDTYQRDLSPASDIPVAVVESVAAEVLPSPKAHPMLSTLSEFSRSLGQMPRRQARPSQPQGRATALTPSLALQKSPLRSRAVAPTPPPAAVANVRTDANPQHDTTASVTVEQLRHAGITALKENRPHIAAGHFDKLVERQPQLADGWLYLVRALTQQGNDGEAESRLVEALASVTDTAPVARELARRMLGRQANAEALKLLEAYRPRQSLDADHDAFIAAVLQRLGQHARAADTYRAVLAVRPESSAWWVGLAISEEARGHSQAALDAYRHARNIGNLDAALAAYAHQRIAAMQGGDAS